MENVEKLTDCGRKLDKFMSAREVVDYLGINKDIVNNNSKKELKKNILREFLNFEKEFKNQNVDFALNKDFTSGVYKYNIIKTGKYISAFTL